MKKKLRIASLIMLIVETALFVFAFQAAYNLINCPGWLMNIVMVVLRVGPIVMVVLFVSSFFVKGKK